MTTEGVFMMLAEDTIEMINQSAFALLYPILGKIRCKKRE
jgi:hypothetical protein